VKQKWVNQDPALINGDICIRCGHCCKATLPVHQPFQADDNHKKQKTEYISTVFADVPTIKIVDITNSITNETRVSIVKTCAKLKTTEEGFKVCSIYEKRPIVCKAFNCIATANHSQQTPQNWDNIKKLIKEYPTEGVELLV
tara:strand:+ start:71 stop:496 length:426 start_codon:yes stop_codon:yes gene_type:complete